MSVNWGNGKQIKQWDGGSVGVSNNVSSNVTLDNNSGQGKNSPVLDIVSKRFNWGVFCFGWIWGLANKSYIPVFFIPLFILLGFIPLIGAIIALGITIWFGTQGNKWAWQNSRWQNIEHFHSVQKKWAIAGAILQLVIIPIIILIYTLFITLAIFNPIGISDTKSFTSNNVEYSDKQLDNYDSTTEDNDTSSYKSTSSSYEDTSSNEDDEDYSVSSSSSSSDLDDSLNKLVGMSVQAIFDTGKYMSEEKWTDFSSKGIAKYVYNILKESSQNPSISGNTVTWSGSSWSFDGDGRCTSSNSCYAVVVNKYDSTVKTRIPLRINNEGFLSTQTDYMKK